MSAYQKRVLLISDGVISTGISNPERLYELARVYGRQGVNLSTVGLGADFDLPLMQTLAELGAGSFYFIENSSALTEVFEEEVKSFLVPVARDVELTLTPAEGYRFRAAYATRLWRAHEGSVQISLPAVYLAGRLNNNDTGMSGGRRGGGGGIVVELTPTLNGSGGERHPVANVEMTFHSASDDASPSQQRAEVINPLPFGEVAEGSYASPSVEKAFVVLNLYVGMKMGLQRAHTGARGAALSVLVPLKGRVEAWYEAQGAPDVDILSDLEVLTKLIDIIAAGEDIAPFESTSAEVQVSPWPQD